MQLKFLCTYWGREALGARAFLDAVLAEGYDGVEVNMPEDASFIREFADRLVEIRSERPGFVFVAQQVLPPAAESPVAYSARMEARLRALVALRPDAINAHTGKDHYSFADNCRIIEAAEAITTEVRIPLWHEIHRGRFTFHAATLLPYLERFPQLLLTADYSHWCTVSESLLEDQEALLRRSFTHVRHLHARVGSAQAPQVADPFAPEWSSTLTRFAGWWQELLEQAVANGLQQFTIIPEAGPAPYMPAMPFSTQPLADQHDVNRRMKAFLQTELKP